MLRLLKQYADSIDELRNTGVIRSKNNPLADYSEWICAQALGLTLCRKSTKGHDAVDVHGAKYEIKARRLTSDNGSRQLSALRSLDGNHFDYLVGVLFSRDFTVKRGALIPWNIVYELATFKPHTNAWILQLRDQVWQADGVIDVTPQLRVIESRL